MQLQTLTPELEADHDRLAFTILLACRNHNAQVRKGTTIPYISHLLQVAGLVLEYGGSLTQAAAGALHDVVEDTTMTVESVRLMCGRDIAELVAACTDTDESDATGETATGEKIKAPWRVRKERYLARLANVSDDALLVIACDKLHNLSNQVADLWHNGKTVEFNAPIEDRVWLAEATLDALKGRIPARLYSDLETCTYGWMKLQETEQGNAEDRAHGLGLGLRIGGFTPPTAPATPGPVLFVCGGDSPALDPADHMVKLPGSEWSFRCDCGCNVFKSPVGEPNTFVCNSCAARWIGERSPESTEAPKVETPSEDSETSVDYSEEIDRILATDERGDLEAEVYGQGIYGGSLERFRLYMSAGDEPVADRFLVKDDGNDMVDGWSTIEELEYNTGDTVYGSLDDFKADRGVPLRALLAAMGVTDATLADYPEPG